MPSSFRPSRLIGNFAALIGLVLVGSFFFDSVAGWFGYATTVFCVVLKPVMAFASGVGALLTSVGLIIYVTSVFKSEAGLSLVLGGMMLIVVPMMLPHYLGAVCSP